MILNYIPDEALVFISICVVVIGWYFWSTRNTRK